MESETLFSNRSSAALLRRLEEERRLLVKEANAPAQAESEPLSSRQPSYSSGAPSQRSARHTPYEAQPPPPPHAGDHGLCHNEDEDVVEEEEEERYAVTTSEGEDGAQYRRRLDPASREHRGCLDAREEAAGGGGGAPSGIAKVTIVQGDRDALVIRPQDALEATSGGSARPAPPLLLFERGLFQIQIQSFVDIPLVAKLEVDGGMTRSNFRVLPRGVHTIRETRAAIGQHGVPLAFQPTESHLLPMPAEVIDDSDMLAEVINERTGILRVLLFAVYDTETRNYKWKWDPSAPLQIEEFRYGLAETFVGQQFPEVGQWLRSGSTAYRQPRARGGQRSNTQTPLEQNPLLLHTALNPPPPPFQKDSGAGRAGRSHSNEDRRRSSRNGSPHDDAHPAATTTAATNPRGRQHQPQPSSQQQRDVPHRRNHTEVFDDIPMVQSTLSYHYYNNNDPQRNNHNEKRHHHVPSGAAQYQDRDKEGAGIRSQSSSESRPRADNSGSGGLSKFLQLYPICETCNPVVERIVASVVRQKQIEVDELNLAYRQQREELREAQYRIKQLQKQVIEMKQNGTGETTTTRRASRSPPMTKSSRLREERSLAKQQPITTEDGASFGSKHGKPSARESLVSVKPRVIHGHQPVAPPQALARGVRETVVVPHHRPGDVLALAPPPTALPARATLPNQDPSSAYVSSAVALPSTAVATAIPAAGELGRGVEPRSSRTYQDALDEEWDRIVFGRAADSFQRR